MRFNVRAMATSFVVVVVTSLLTAMSASAGQPPAQEDPRATASISGRITSARTGEPIAGASARIVSFDVMRVARSASTDADGRYEFTSLVPGRYQLEARAERYLTTMFGGRRPPDRGRQIDLRDKEAFADADIALYETSAITGFVLDEFGDPAPNILVQASSARFIAGRRRLYPVSGGPPQLTDDLGQFRIDNLGPGDYYLTALTGAFASSEETGGFAPTFYPGTTAVAGAQAVSVGASSEVASITFALSPAPMVELAGRLVDEAGQPVPQGTVWFTPTWAEEGPDVLIMARGVSGSDGTFTFRNVPPGTYVVQAFGRPVGGGNLGRSPFGWREVTLGAEGRLDADVLVRTGATLRGTIVFEGTSPRPAPNEVRISAGPVEFKSSPLAGGPSPSVTRDDWTFEVGAMSGLRVIRTDIRSAVWMLKQVKLNGADITDTPIDFRGGDDVDDIEVVITDSAATLSGSVVDQAGQPAVDYAVVVFSSDPSEWTFPSRRLHLALPNQTGGFRAPGLPAGEYLAVALSAVDPAGWEDPEYLMGLRALATAITLNPGVDAALSLKIVR